MSAVQANAQVGPSPLPRIRLIVQADGVERWERPHASDRPAWVELFRQVWRVVAPSSNDLPFSGSVAFLVGVGTYKHFESLPNVANDLADMRDYLLTDGGFDTVYVARDTVVSEELIEGYMRTKLPKLVGRRGRILFYFAGHGGGVEADNTGYMLLNRAVQSDFSHDAIAIKRTVEWSLTEQPAHMLFIVDACASGLGWRTRDVPDDESTTIAVESALSGNGSRALMTAGSGAERTFEVFDSQKHGNGLFTRALLDVLRASDDPFVIPETLIGAARVRMAALALQQNLPPTTPRLWELTTDSLRGTFLFLNPRGKKTIPERLRAVRATRGTSPKSDFLAAERAQLFNGDLGHRMDAVHQLDRVAQDFPAVQDLVIKVFTDFLRAKVPWKGGVVVSQSMTIRPSPDVQEVLSVIGHRLWSRDSDQVFDRAVLPDRTIDLSNLDLRGASLDAALLNFVDLRGTHLENAFLRSAHLQATDLREAHLEGVHLEDAYLKDVVAERGHFEGAILDGADMRQADFEATLLDRASLLRIDSMGADFYDASLKGANLRQFKFEEVELDGAKLDGAHVEGANFLRSPNLEQEQLDVAIGDAQTVIPRKFKRPSRWASRP